MEKIKAAIAGGTGYTAGELLRILINHPNVEVAKVISTSHAGVPVTDIHRDLLGECDLTFTDDNDLTDIDVIFLCLGHGVSREFMQTHDLPAQCKVIDLGNDFRLKESSTYDQRNFMYGLPETSYKQTANTNIANPGCFATAIELALLPLAKSNLLTNECHINAITGATGAGRKLDEKSHFSYRENNISVYKVFRHQHLAEIRETLQTNSHSQLPKINFVPIRGCFTRGIFTSIYTKCDLPIEEITQIYTTFYSNAPFIIISDKEISLKEVVNTNKCLIHLEKIDEYLYINSAIDNLIKGACGQAVQNMNILFNLDQTTGLRLKPSAF